MRKKHEKAQRRNSGPDIEFDVSNPAGMGGMKEVFFTKDRQNVVAFYHNNSKSDDRENRLEQVIYDYNPTRDGQSNAAYWSNLFCWPSEIVDHPKRGIGIVLPVYPDCFFFKEGTLKGIEKNGCWFTGISPLTRRPFRYSRVEKSERGDLRLIVEAMICLSRTIQRMHNAGLAHSDLSENNVLIDPTSGRSLVIDVDALVVTGLFPPEVLGSKGYIAPEILATRNLPIDDPKRKHPSAETDKHSLAVMIYKYLMERHPLEGKRIFIGATADEVDHLTYGSKAIYCESLENSNNRPKGDNYLPSTILGKKIADMFHRAFVDGITNPMNRPLSGEWENTLSWVSDNMVKCGNTNCDYGWFVFLNEKNSNCPYCSWKSKDKIGVFEFEKESPAGWFRTAGSLVLNASVSQNLRTRIYKHHIENGALRGPGEDSRPIADVCFMESPYPGYYLNNLSDDKMLIRNTETGDTVFHEIPPSKKLLLQEGMEIRFNSSKSNSFFRARTLFR